MFSRCSRDSEATAYLSAKFDFFRLFLRTLPALKSLANAMTKKSTDALFTIHYLFIIYSTNY